MIVNKNQIEKVVCAAIWYDDGKIWPHQPANVKTGIVVSGLRHPICFVLLSILYKENLDLLGDFSPEGLRIHIKRNVEQGFLTNHNRFVDRTEGGQIAIASGQIEKLKYDDNEMYSEDLY
jgi:hypothetical protein